MSIVISNAFKVIEGRPVTSSRIVAEYFGKQHHHVVRDIRSLIEQKPSLEASANFGEWSEEVEIGSGAKRTVTGYWMDQKGFCILAMGFTGAKALEFKCAFYDEFERMKNELEGRRIEPATLTPAEQRAIQVAVAGRAKKLAASYQAIYRAIKARYQIAKYDQLPRTLLKNSDARCVLTLLARHTNIATFAVARFKFAAMRTRFLTDHTMRFRNAFHQQTSLTFRQMICFMARSLTVTATHALCLIKDHSIVRAASFARRGLCFNTESGSTKTSKRDESTTIDFCCHNAFSNKKGGSPFLIMRS